MLKLLVVLFLIPFICFGSEEIEQESSTEEVAFLGQESASAPSLQANELLSTPKTMPTSLDPSAKKSPALAVFLSSLVPGMGHYYLGEIKTGSILLGTNLGSFLSTPVLGGQKELRWMAPASLVANYSYGLYAAYRDARNINGQGSYRYSMPTDSFADLAYAPVNIAVISKPEVWGGFLGALSLACTVSYLGWSSAKLSFSSCSSMSYTRPFQAFPVGIGEESLFRGYLQPAISEFSNPMVGLALSTLLFGAAHIPNATFLPEGDRWRYYSFNLPVITLLGGYMGYLTQKNASLKESVALHIWYDFALFAADLAFQQAAIGKMNPNFHFSFEF